MIVIKTGPNTFMVTVLLTLGRLPKALALARACRAAGCRVLIADPFRWHVCRPSRDVAKSFRVTAPNTSRQRYLDELAQIVREESVDIVLPVSEEALHVAELPGLLPEGVQQWSCNAVLLARLHDKYSFVNYARDLGLAVPETHLANTSEAKRLAAARAFVEKPIHSCSGIGLRFGDAGEPLHCEDAGGVVQERLEGELISSLALVHDGRILGSVFYRGRVFAGTVAICFERVDDAGSCRQWVENFVERCDYSGLLAFDFIVGSDDVARAIECNPRATSGVHFFDPASLGRALVDPARCDHVSFTPGVRYQWAYSTLTETYAAILKPREFARRFREMLRARDVVWSASDPLPFLLMTPMSWEILWPAMTSKQTLGEATQRDIAWFGDTP